MLDPQNPYILGDYANFLLDVRRDYDQAEDFYKRAIESNTTDAGDIGNYAKILIVRGDLDQAKTMIKKAFEYNQKHKDLELDLQLWFYRYAVFYEEFPGSKTEIETLLAQGVRSIGGYLKDVLEVAEKRGHPDYQQLLQYESRMTSKED